MRLGSGQPHHRQFRGNHLHATAQIGYGLNESTLTGIYDDNVVRFRQGSNGRLNFPPVRLARAPRVNLCGDVLEGLGIRSVTKGSRKAVSLLADLVEQAIRPVSGASCKDR